MSFFNLEIFCDKYFGKLIAVYSCYSYPGVVFQIYYFNDFFRLVNFGFSSNKDKKIYLILYASVIYFDYLAVFVHICDNNYTDFSMIVYL